MKRRPSIVLEDSMHPWRKSAFGLIALALFSGLLTACGSAPTSQASSAAVQNVCQDLSVVLANGPDPDVDPVGYALAQVKPLRQIETSDRSLQTAIDGLASAYEQIVTTSGSQAAKRGVTEASDRVNAICPGAAS